MWTRVGLMATAVVLTACPPSSGALVFRLPDGATAKDATFDFGARGATVSRTFALVNASQVDVPIADAQLEGAFAASVPATALVAGAELPVVVAYVPSAEDTGTLTIRSSSGEPLASLALTGRFEGALCALPDVVDFGASLVGEAVQRTIAFPVHDTRRDVFVGAPPSPFQFPAGAPSGSQSVGAGEAFSAKIQLPAPRATAELSGTWRLDSGGGCAPKDVPVRATVLSSYLSAAPVDFGVTPAPGQPSSNASLKNALSRAVTVTLEVQSTSGGPTTNFRTGLLQVELPPATRDATGTWKPGVAEVPLTAWLLGPGTVQGTLVVTAASPSEKLEVPLVARGAGAGLSVRPSLLELQVPVVGASVLPVSTVLAVSNEDRSAMAATVAVTSVTIEAETGTSLSELCVGASSMGTCTAQAAFTVAPGAEARIPILATPTGAGPWRWFVVLHTDDALVPELRVEVKAQPSPQGDCTLQQPQAVRFGPVRAPTPMTHALVLENQGLTPCVVQGLWVDGSTDVHAERSFTVGPGERKLVDLEYAPTTAPGTATLANVRYSVNSVNSPVRAIPLEAMSDDGCLFLSPEQFDFGTVGPSCAARVQRFAVGNRCATDVNFSGFRVRGTGPFTVDGMPETRVAANTLVPDAVTVSFDPTVEGAFTGTLEFDVVLPTGTRPLIVPLRGVATLAARQKDRFVVPTSVDALVVQDATTSMAPLFQSLSLQSQAFVDAALTRARSVRLASIDGEGAGALRDIGGQRWLDLELQPVQPLASLLGNPAMSSAAEQFREPTLKALSGANVSGPNRGFLRRTASLGVLVMTDAKDQSAVPVSVWLPQVLALKGSHRPERLRWSHVGPLAPTAPSGCAYDDAVTSLTDELAATNATGGVQLEVCQARTTPSLITSQVVPALFGDRDGFAMRAPVAPGTMPAVTVGGVAVPELSPGGGRNWTFDVTRRAVSFSGLSLRSGDVVELEYSTLCP